MKEHTETNWFSLCFCFYELELHFSHLISNAIKGYIK